MGNQQSTDWGAQYSLLQTVTQNHSRVALIAQPRTEYSRISLFLEPAEKYILLDRLRRRQEAGNNLLQKVVRVFQKQGGMCANFEQLDIIWTLSSPTLLDHCRYRRAKRVPFQEAEVLEVVRSVSLSLEYLESMGEVHGSVDLSSVIVQESIHLKDPIFSSNQQDEHLSSSRPQTYPSPQKMRQQYDVVLTLGQLYTDLFSLGVVALQMCYLQRDIRKEIYRPRQAAYLNWSVDFARIEQLLQEIPNKILNQCIRILLSPEEIHRKTIYTLNYQFQINRKSLKLLSHNPFSIAPEEELFSDIEPYTDTSCQTTLVTPPMGPNKITVLNIAKRISEPINDGEKLARTSLITIGSSKLPTSKLREQNEGGKDRSLQLFCQQPKKSQLSLAAKELYRYPAYRQVNSNESRLMPFIDAPKYEQMNLENKPIRLNNFVVLEEAIKRLSNDLKNLISSSEIQISQRQATEPPLFASKSSKIIADPSIVSKIVIQEDSAEQSCSDAQFVVEEYEIGTRYEGYKRNGKRNGRGKFYYSQGSAYMGEWRDNKMSGFGKLTYPNGCTAYEGQWVDDEFHGRGTLFNADPTDFTGLFDYRDFNNSEGVWLTYEGELKRGKRDGEGRLVLINGECFEGEFRRDNIEGPGVFYCLTGKRIQGVWRQNLLTAIPYNVYS